LTSQEVDDLTNFLENGLYDPAFLRHDPRSSTDTLQPNERDLTYSKYRPDLAALGAKDGFMLSGLAIDDNDPLARRDQGLEFLDVTSQVDIEKIASNNQGRRQTDEYRITNSSASIVDTHLLIVIERLSDQIRLKNASGITSTGDPYIRVFLADGVLLPGQSIVQTLLFTRQSSAPPISYSLNLLSGQGNP
jgi:hypothetical protein